MPGTETAQRIKSLVSIKHGCFRNSSIWRDLRCRFPLQGSGTSWLVSALSRFTMAFPTVHGSRAGSVCAQPKHWQPQRGRVGDSPKPAWQPWHPDQEGCKAWAWAEHWPCSAGSADGQRIIDSPQTEVNVLPFVETPDCGLSTDIWAAPYPTEPSEVAPAWVDHSQQGSDMKAGHLQEDAAAPAPASRWCWEQSRYNF